MRFTVKQLADLAGVSVRTLHHYDHIGLLKPSFIHENGYRYYEDKEVVLLQQILFFRELEFPLEKIGEIITHSTFNSKQALQDQKNMLLMKQKKITELIKTIDDTVITLEGGEDSMNIKHMFGPFNDEQYMKYKDEVKERWGNTNAYKQSKERMKKWTKADLEKIKKEGGEITLSIANNMENGVNNSQVQADIQKHFQHMNVFYECSPEMYKNLGQMYVDDQRFTAFYEKIRPGLAIFMRDAMAFFVENQSK